MSPFRYSTFSIGVIFFAYLLVTTSPGQADSRSFISDSLLLEKYIYEIESVYVENSDSFSREEVDSIFFGSRLNILENKVTYSPDSTFKIFVVELEGCGAYCNSEWFSWTHYNLKKNEIVRPADFSTSNNFTEIDSIYKLSDGKYLVVECMGYRPASVLTVNCIAAQLISFSADSIINHPIKYNQRDYFGFCQENGVQSDEQPYIKYDHKKKLLAYYYGKNYLYSKGLDIDTIRRGQFKYIKGQFVLEKETIQVIDRRDPNDK